MSWSAWCGLEEQVARMVQESEWMEENRQTTTVDALLEGFSWTTLPTLHVPWIDEPVTKAPIILTPTTSQLTSKTMVPPLQILCLEKRGKNMPYLESQSFFSFTKLGKGRKLVLMNLRANQVKAVTVSVRGPREDKQTIFPSRKGNNSVKKHKWSSQLAIPNPTNEEAVFLRLREPRVLGQLHRLMITLYFYSGKTVMYSQAFESAGHKYETGKKQINLRTNTPFESVVMHNGNLLVQTKL